MRGKRIAIILIVIVVVLGLLGLAESAKGIKASSFNANQSSFLKDWEKISKELKNTEDYKVHGLMMSIKGNGEIEYLYCDLISKSPKTKLYQLHYSSKTKKYTLKDIGKFEAASAAKRVHMSGKELFSVLDIIDYKTMLTGKNNEELLVYYDILNSPYSKKDRVKTFLIKDNKMQDADKIKDGIKADIISIDLLTDGGGSLVREYLFNVE